MIHSSFSHLNDNNKSLPQQSKHSAEQKNRSKVNNLNLYEEDSSIALWQKD